MFNLVPGSLFSKSLFDEFFESRGALIQSKEDSYAISLDVPGMTKEDLSIEVKDNFIVVSGTKEVAGQLRSVRQCFSLPKDVNLETCEGSVENGILTVSLGRKPKADVKKLIPIK